jgi:formylmethanofuran dehydrogenase subunit E
MMSGNPREVIDDLIKAGDLKALLKRAAEIHGHFCPGLAFGVKAGCLAMKRLGLQNTGMEEVMAIVECNHCFVDGIQMTTGCTLGNNALLYKDLGKTAVTVLSRKDSKAIRIALKPGRWTRDDASPRQKEAGDLFQRIVVERQEDPKALSRMSELWRELSFETVEADDEELFEFREVSVKIPEYAPIFDSAVCAICGEEFMETRGTLVKGKTACLSCAGADYMMLAGRGIHSVPGGKTR